ncbi:MULTISPECIES: SCP2 domain-containing protein [Chitinibacter]|uniref:ubiquinone anaerobic biosynthesis accessory factor UbiT n=1 Tax=Chitinibacter TaxID=230666 RepID=UPI000647FC25|nr:MULTISPECIES: SCP2 sterol-binding domain-containing protein [Chitinibacter]
MVKLPALVQKALQKLPEQPPAFILSQTLNWVKQPLWPEEDFSWLEGRTVRLEVSDLGCGLSYSFANGRFIASQAPADVCFAASLADYWILARRQEDPDTLFFQRRLRISGDTELGLQLKNLMDATDFSPLFARLPAPLRQRFAL